MNPTTDSGETTTTFLYFLQQQLSDQLPLQDKLFLIDFLQDALQTHEPWRKTATLNAFTILGSLANGAVILDATKAAGTTTHDSAELVLRTIEALRNLTAVMLREVIPGEHQTFVSVSVQLLYWCTADDAVIVGMFSAGTTNGLVFRASYRVTA